MIYRECFATIVSCVGYDTMATLTLKITSDQTLSRDHIILFYPALLLVLGIFRCLWGSCTGCEDRISNTDWGTSHGLLSISFASISRWPCDATGCACESESLLTSYVRIMIHAVPSVSVLSHA
ncbi:hypothetical protein GY45DRAFT_1323270 [Cubamyces sp. BRFM 1775]|nr:hypothetical protein GY45DRAFT_1323270 [Cubamyces sp. BRFM 1775]